MKAKFKNRTAVIIIVAVLIVVFIGLKYFGFASTRSGTRIGFTEHVGLHDWSASYSLLNGSMEKAIFPNDDALDISVETISGTFSILIRNTDGIVFEKENIENESFSIPVSGRVVVRIKANNHKGNFEVSSHSLKSIQVGQIYLYGEEHAVKSVLNEELDLWNAYYRDNGMRHLFVELPYYSAELLNVWMQSENDEILDLLYQDWEGTAMHSPDVIDFYKQIKNDCPETVFHGVDVGHQYDTTGARYILFLHESGYDETSELYRRAETVIAQGQQYYQEEDSVYRENMMTENFIWEYDRLDGADVMGIFGTAHTGPEGLDYITKTVPCMANQLAQYYGTALHAEDLTLAKAAYAVETFKIGEKEYIASYFGQMDLSAFFPDYQYREYWLLESAYDDFKDYPTTGNVLPYNNYPMEIEKYQVYVVEYTKTDGSVIREYHRADGNMWQGTLVTEEISID